MKKEILKPTEIIVHLTGTADNLNYEKASELEQHFAGEDPNVDPIPYHYLITLAGTRSIGRNKNEVCRHLAGHDATSYSIMLVGGIDAITEEERDTSNDKQLEMLAYTIKELRIKYPNLTVHSPHELDPYCTEPEFDTAHFKQLYPDLFNVGQGTGGSGDRYVTHPNNKKL